MKRSMIEMRFVDTNVLIYAVGLDPTEFDKRIRARRLLEEPELVISVQVLHEFYNQATRPNRSAPMTHDEALGFIGGLMVFYFRPMTVEIFHTAASISHRYGLSYWDGAILAAAQSTG